MTLLEQLNARVGGPQTFTSPWSKFLVGADNSGERDGYLWSRDEPFLFVLASVQGDSGSFLRFRRPIEGIRADRDRDGLCDPPFLARYEEERGAGHSVREALERATEGAGPGIVHAAGTTAVALFTLTLTQVRALRELGFING